MFYWGDYLAIAILISVASFATGWVMCSLSYLRDEE